MTDRDIKPPNLRSLAERATPGPWVTVESASDGKCWRVEAVRPPVDLGMGPEHGNETVIETDAGYYPPNLATARYVAAANPSAVLELLAALKEALDIADASGLNMDTIEESRAADARIAELRRRWL